MGDRVRIYLGHRDKSTEGHIKQCVAYFNLRPIWGFPEPINCHENTIEIKRALEEADSRFALIISDKPKSIEGHRATIDIKKGNKYYLQGLQTHENMKGLQLAVDNALDKAGTTFGAEEKATALDAGEKNTALDAEEKEQRECMCAHILSHLKPQCPPNLLLKIKADPAPPSPFPSPAVSPLTHTSPGCISASHISITSNLLISIHPSKANFRSRNDEYTSARFLFFGPHFSFRR